MTLTEEEEEAWFAYFNGISIENIQSILRNIEEWLNDYKALHYWTLPCIHPDDRYAKEEQSVSKHVEAMEEISELMQKRWVFQIGSRYGCPNDCANTLWVFETIQYLLGAWNGFIVKRNK